jgi:hypothetical protein
MRIMLNPQIQNTELLTVKAGGTYSLPLRFKKFIDNSSIDFNTQKNITVAV